MTARVSLCARAAIAGLLFARLAAAATWIGESTMLGGTARFDRGEWIYQDFVYDDYGADTAPFASSNVVLLAPTTGDFRYPPDEARYGNNAADVVEIRVRPNAADPAALDIRVTLNTLLAADSTVVGIAIDKGAGAPRPWPFKAGVQSVWEEFITVAAGEVQRTTADGSTEKIGTATVDLGENTIELTVPGAAAGSSVTLSAGAGLWDAANGEWLAGAPSTSGDPSHFDSGGGTDVRVFDLAFNSRELEPRFGDWQEDAQAAALASGDVSAFRQTVDLDRLRGGASDPPIVAPGFYDRIFRSAQNLGEGVRLSGFPEYFGKFQPYALWVPKGYDPTAPTPLLLLLHSLSVHHNQYAGGPAFNTMYEQLGDGLGALIATPLARGPDGWYWDEGLVDTLEAWADVRTHYSVDDDRTSSTGYSMGGYGTYRLATLMPDRFAAAVSWVGPPAHQLWLWPLDPVPIDSRQRPGNTFFQLENTEHVPFFIVQGTSDELVPPSGVVHQAEHFHDLGYEHRLNLHPGLDHFAFAFLDEWSRERAWLDGRARVANPAHVVLKVRPFSWATPARPEAERATILSLLGSLGADLDSAYWVRDVVVGGTGDVTGIVDLTSEGIRSRVPVTTEVAAGVKAGPPTPFVERGIDRVLGTEARANVLRGTLQSVSALTVDLDRAGLTLDGLEVAVVSDRGTKLTLASSSGSQVVELPASIVQP